ncbi:MAG: alpha/beta hydrolase-fold protein [Phycisphaerales bacterium]
MLHRLFEGRRARWLAAILAAISASARADDRVSVVFETTQTTVLGDSIYVLGDLPELGGNDLRRAVKLQPAAYPIWRATISLPAGRDYAYRFYRRADAPAQQASTTNGTALGNVINATTPAPAEGFAPPSKTVFFDSSFTSATLHWRVAGAGGAFTARPMERHAAGSAAGRTRFFTWGFGAPRGAIEFHFTRADGTGREPGAGEFTSSLDALLVQGGQIYTYIPAAAPGAARRDYNPASPPAIQSTNLGESRRYRVFLPRGYDAHATRRYPVLYMHDGQNVFEVGPFGSWNGAPTFTSLQQQGRAREVIVVGVDNGPNRLNDYAAPDAGGWADRYARFLRDELKPLIDAQYRTLPGAATTGTMGSSMGGQVSLYLAWDFTSTFTRAGAMSGAFQVFNSGFYNRVQSQPVPAIRVWLDSGDSGPSSDNYWPIYNLRDNLLNPARAGGAGNSMSLAGNLMHRVGLGQQHNEAAWAARLPEAVTFLYPADEDQHDLFAVFNPVFDVNADGTVNLDDLHALGESPRDITLDGNADEADVRALESHLRRDELDSAAR